MQANFLNIDASKIVDGSRPIYFYAERKGDMWCTHQTTMEEMKVAPLRKYEMFTIFKDEVEYVTKILNDHGVANNVEDLWEATSREPILRYRVSWRLAIKEEDHDFLNLITKCAVAMQMSEREAIKTVGQSQGRQWEKEAWQKKLAVAPFWKRVKYALSGKWED